MGTWIYENNALGDKQLKINESLFALGNGYLGVRGCFEEGYAPDYDTIRGTYINGVYDRVPIVYPEKQFGFPEIQDKQPNLIDTQTIHIELDGEAVELFSGTHANFSRQLHMDRGYSVRSFDFHLKSGKTARVVIERLVSLKFQELFVQRVNVHFDGSIKIISSVNCDVSNYSKLGDPRVGSQHARLLSIDSMRCFGESCEVSYQTARAGVPLATRVSHKVSGVTLDRNSGDLDDGSCAVFSYTGDFGQATLTKYSVFTDGLRYSQPLSAAGSISDMVCKLSFDQLLDEQTKACGSFWSGSDISIDGNPGDQLALRFNLFHLYQSVGKDRFSNISAKGLTGEGYEGHYFWDTEIYVLPVFQVSQHHIVRSLLMFRFSQLEAARARARVLGHGRGAKYPWRTISGIESSSYFPAGTAQYHINADVARAFLQYFDFTGDLQFMISYGLEVLIETARIWLEIGHFSGQRFLIDCVTGPDEYTALVNNNYYTNAMARMNMEGALRVLGLALEYDPASTKKLMARLMVSHQELGELRSAAELMYLPHDRKLGIDLQDDAFIDKKAWDFENTPKTNYPLLMHYHPLTLYRHQVLKQPDTVLAHFLAESYTDIKTIEKSYDYYEAITTHDSSLSGCVYGIMASRLGKCEKAYRYFRESLRLDIDNIHGNTEDGLHMANLAGSAMMVLYGFAGLRVSEDGLLIRPNKPDEWAGYAFVLDYRHRRVEISVTDQIRLFLLEGDPLSIRVYDREILLEGTATEALDKDKAQPQP